MSITPFTILVIIVLFVIPAIIYGTCRLIQYLAYNRGWKWLQKFADKIGD